MMGYYLGSHLPLRELQQGIKGSYCPDNILLGDQYSALALRLVKREMETCPDAIFPGLEKTWIFFLDRVKLAESSQFNESVKLVHKLVWITWN